ncbi:hypothetical protein BJX96DRAFT_137990 [Aspergillus floccosus]
METIVPTSPVSTQVLELSSSALSYILLYPAPQLLSFIPPPLQSTMAEPVSASEHKHSLLGLPTELHLQIASYLPYPDALALKHTSRHFYSFVYTGVHLKVDWLVERFELKLECPMEKCSFRTDEAFCNARIRRIMGRRRRHLECRRQKGGCLVIGGETCQKVLVPTWLKGSRRLELLKFVGDEVLIHGLIFLCVNLLWHLVVRVSRLVLVS